jgi:hypothetical protein
MATFTMPGWYTQRRETAAIAQLQQQAAQAASAYDYDVCGDGQSFDGACDADLFFDRVELDQTKMYNALEVRFIDACIN